MLLEVLITAIIVAIGLLGLAKLQARSAIVQIESYQRTQALLLAQDMADRMLANKSNASAYIASDYGMRARSGCPGTGAQRDGCDWDAALRGASERVGATPVGTLRGGRGCINAIGARRYQVVVAWQGMLPTVAPQSDCARDRYGPDAHRRIVVVPVELPDLGAT